MAAATLPLLALPVGAEDAAGPKADAAPVPAPAPASDAGVESDAGPKPSVYTFQRVRAWWVERQRYSVVQAGMIAAFLLGTLFLSAFTLPLLLPH